MQKPIVILGIDPGLASTGFGIISVEHNKTSLIDFGCITTPQNESFSERLGIICRDIQSIIKEYRPSYASIEELFFCKNVKTALRVGQAKGAIIVACQINRVPVHEFTPLQVKQSITGYGNASKMQVQKMVKTLLRMETAPLSNHAADALAIALCCAHTLSNTISSYG